MSTIYQADQYYIPFRVKQNGKLITPENIDGIRITIGGVVQVYPKGQLTFDGVENWLFFLESSASQHMIGNTPCQVEFKKGDIRQHSPVFIVDVQKSMLKGDW